MGNGLTACNHSLVQLNRWMIGESLALLFPVIYCALHWLNRTCENMIARVRTRF